MIQKLKEYLREKQNEYRKEGFGDYKDIETAHSFQSTDLIDYEMYKKEIDRVQFFLDMMDEIEKKNKSGKFD